MTWMKGSESNYTCRLCGKNLFFTEKKRLPRGVQLLAATDIVEGKDGRAANAAGLVYFHNTLEETEACGLILTLTKGAKP